jgi:hypothetical protein
MLRSFLSGNSVLAFLPGVAQGPPGGKNLCATLHVRHNVLRANALQRKTVAQGQATILRNDRQQPITPAKTMKRRGGVFSQSC